MSNYQLYHGDCLEIMPTLADDSIDAIVTDPPYELAFMGKKWDGTGIAYNVTVWRECLRVLKPGGHLLAFGGTRTSHRMVCAIEDAGFEIRDSVLWLYGSGFPKSLDVSKAIDKAAGAAREVVGARVYADGTTARKTSAYVLAGETLSQTRGSNNNITAPATEAAKQWLGWGTALKPACEPICVARKPLEGTVAANVLKHGTGAINVDACRVGTEQRYNLPAGNKAGGNSLKMSVVGMPQDADGRTAVGRWPANVLHDGSEEVLAAFGMFGESKQVDKRMEKLARTGKGTNGIYGDYGEALVNTPSYPDTGTAARFFKCCPFDDNDNLRFYYSAKASRSDRGTHTKPAMPLFGIDEETFTNTHATVKPIALMRYLVKLVTQPGGIVLDPFTGSGTTAVAALMEGFRFVGIELEVDHINIAQGRIESIRSSTKPILRKPANTQAEQWQPVKMFGD